MSSETQAELKVKHNALLIGSFALSAYFAIAVWNFWSTFINALGFNATALILGTVLLFMVTHGITAWKNHFAWAFPILLVALSFSLWENPYLKVISILLLPFVLSIAFNCALHPNKNIDIKFIVLSMMERVSFVLKLPEAFRLVFNKLFPNGEREQKLIPKIIFGLLLFFILALTIFIPLLSSVDPQFAELMKGISEWFYDLLSFRYMGRILFTIFAAFFLISYFLSFQEGPTSAKDPASPKKNTLDPVVSGIVLGGVLALYLLFIALQFSRLWISQLPFDFHQTEQLVKSGFWQLLLLSVINIVFFFGYFRKTNALVQNILKAFTIASFLLLVSAGHRMFLYTFFYGLSYEKFFASYTVLYCAMLFVWLAYQLFAHRESNIFKYLVFSLLWMYSIATVIPVERIIFSVNARLVERPDSRINMNELRMLSYDALPLAAAYRKDTGWRREWCSWANSEIQRVETKQWYEKNLANFATVQVHGNWKNGNCEPPETRTRESEPAPTPPRDDRKIYDDADFSFQVKYPNEEWKIIRFFDLEKNQNKGVYIYKDEKTNIAVLPLGKDGAVYPTAKSVVLSITLGNFSAKKTAWETADGSGMISIKLTAYPTSWNDKHVIEAKYTKDNKQTVEEIIQSLTFKEK
jgi:hypothetical protein